jgi:hypothetical protein
MVARQPRRRRGAGARPRPAAARPRRAYRPLAAALLLTGCAQFRPPAGGEAATRSSDCAVRGDVYSYADQSGSTVSNDGLSLRGKLAGQGEIYAGIGIELDAPYDASRYQGIAFQARRAAGGAAHVRLKLPDGNTDPDGGVCTDCYNDFGIGFEVGEAWTRYEARFSDLAQETGWGTPRPPALDAARLHGVQWQVATPGAEVGLEIQDVVWLGCGNQHGL